MKSFILSFVAATALGLGAMTSTADAQYRVYRPVYGAPQYNNYYGGQQTYYRGGYYPSGSYRTYYGGYGGGPYNSGYYNGGAYYNGGYQNSGYYNGRAYYNGQYNGGYSQPGYYGRGVTIGVGPRVGFGF
jgi:hypothetical protein